MASLFLLIAALVLRRAGMGPWVAPDSLGASWICLLVGAGTLGPALLSAVAGLAPGRRPGGHAAWSRSARRARWVGTIACAWLALCILGLGWLDLVRDVVGDLVLVDEALALAPAIAAMVLAWWLHSAYALPGADRRQRAGFVVMQARVHWPLFLVPAALVLGSQEVVDRLVPAGTALGEWIAFIVAIAALLLSPAAVMPLLATAPLPSPDHRSTAIESLFRRDSGGVRVRGVRIWRTGGTLLNALALGILPWCRWVLLSDALVESLSGDEAVAVAGHEAAHFRHHHAAWLAGSLVGGFGCAALGMGALLEWVSPLLPPSPWIDWTATALLVAAAVAFFGVVSRTCERQADADSVRTLSPGDRVDPSAVAAMRRALAVVAFSNGIPPHRRSFRHGSIASRRRRLESIAGLPKRVLPIDRRMRVARLLVILAVLVTIASMAVPAPGDSEAARIIHAMESPP